MKSKTTHKKQVYNKHNINIYKVINSKTKKVNTIKSKSNKTRKVKKNYNRQQLELHNGGGIFDSILPFGLNKRVKNFISNATLVDTLYNKLYTTQRIHDNKTNTSTLKDKIYNFIFNALKKFYYLLKSNKKLFTANYKKYNHKKVFKYNDNNKFSNDIIINVLTNFINLLLSVPNNRTFYPLSSGNINYGRHRHEPYMYHSQNNTFETINRYFENHTMTETSIIEYIKAIIAYDKKIINNNTYTYLLPNKNNNDPIFKYADLLYITQQSLSSNRANNTIFLIIYKKFSSTQLKMSFTYDQNLSHDDFYVLENKFFKLKTELRTIPDDFKKLVNKYNNELFNSKNASLYGEFLFYYYKSFVFSNQK